jgi:hypothetical protein
LREIARLLSPAARCCCVAIQKDVVGLKRFPRKIRNAFAGILPASFSRGVQMKILVTAAILSAFAFSPASAAMMACTSDNMAKSAAMMVSMPDTPGKMAANKEMSMANTDMSNGKMKSACMHYMSAQKASMAK